jgi:hypothetical protein
MVKYRLTWQGAGALDLSQVTDDAGLPVLFAGPGSIVVVNDGTLRHPLVQNYLHDGLKAERLGPAIEAPPPPKTAMPLPPPLPPPSLPSSPPVESAAPPAPPTDPAPFPEIATPPEPPIPVTSFLSLDPPSPEAAEESTRGRGGRGPRGRAR